MRFLELLPLQRVKTDLVAADKPALIDNLADLLAGPSERGTIRDALLARERLGTTGLGHGVAIPHGRSAAVNEARAAFIRLARPIDFGAIDDQPVDLIAALIVPAHFTDEHLQLLAELAEMFSDSSLTTELRRAPDAAAVRHAISIFATTRV